jgi:hypothetical protein
MILADRLPLLKTFLRPLAFHNPLAFGVAHFLTAFLCAPNDPSPTQAAHLDRSTRRRHRCTLARFRADARVSPDWLRCLQVAALLLERAGKPAGTWLLLLDQTYCTRLGQFAENTFARGNKKPRPRQSDRHQKKHARVSCHGFVCALLLTPSGLRLPLFRSFYTKDSCQQLQRPFATQTELAAQLIEQAAVPTGCPTVILGDTAFDAACIRRAAALRQWLWVVPVNPERVLAGPRKARPKVRSLVATLTDRDLTPYRLQPHQGEFVAQRRLSRQRRGPGTPPRTFSVHSRSTAVHSVGEVRLVFSSMQAPQPGAKVQIQKILMTNALSWSAERIVAIYDLCWQMELFFKEGKRGLGLARYRLRHCNRVERWVTLCLVAFSYLEWLRLRRSREGDWGRPAAWWRQQRVGGLREALRERLEEESWEQLGRWSRSQAGLRKLKRCLRQALKSDKAGSKGVRNNKLH